MKKGCVLLIMAKNNSAIYGTLVFDNPAAAYGEAILRLDEMMPEDEYHFSSLYRLEAEAGFGIDAVNEKDPDMSCKAVILDVEEGA